MQQEQIKERKMTVMVVICAVLSVLTAAFIFRNSLQPGAASDAVSLGVVERINAFFAQMNLGEPFGNHLVRKAGHLLEFALLGLWLGLCASSCAALLRGRAQMGPKGYEEGKRCASAIKRLKDEKTESICPKSNKATVCVAGGSAMLAGLGVAIVDECIQLGVPGRSGQVSDVVIDFCGVVAGCALALLASFIAHRLNRGAAASRR